MDIAKLIKGATTIRLCCSSVQHTRGASLIEWRSDVMRWAQYFLFSGPGQGPCNFGPSSTTTRQLLSLSCLSFSSHYATTTSGFFVFLCIRMHSCVAQGDRRINNCHQRCYTDRFFLVLNVAARLRIFLRCTKTEMLQIRKHS